MKRTLIAICASLPVLGADMPPIIPDAPIEYTEITYDDESAPEESAAEVGVNEQCSHEEEAVTLPIAPVMPVEAASSERCGYLNLNLYSSDYAVRGMGVRSAFSKSGYSSIGGSYILPARNLLGLGLQQRISGEYGVIWNASSILAEPHVARASYGIGKEIFPNLVAEVGYTLRHGGLEGYVARHFDGAGHRVTQELTASLTYNDYQQGFFGKVEVGVAFYGLTGTYFDIEAGYRFTDVMSNDICGADLELSAGVAPSVGYWGSGVNGVDAWRIKAAVLPYSHSGSFGRDARFYIKPWVQCSWAGGNSSRMRHEFGHADVVDDFLICVGIDCGFNF